MTPPFRVWAEIDLAALERNLGRIRAALPRHLRYIAVVKADAYGHGLRAVARRLMQAGIDCFAVATIGEARVLAEVGDGWPVLVLSPLLPLEFSEAVALGVMPTVSSQEEVGGLNAAAKVAGRVLPVHLKVDTGMGRAGVWHEEAATVYGAIRETDHLTLAGILTHFASADRDADFTGVQRQRFLAALDAMPGWDDAPRLIHADNSAGLADFPADGVFNGARVGLLQFGLEPRPGSLFDALAVEPVLSLHTRVTLVKALPAGTALSYGGTHVLPRDSRIALLGAGYADGLATTMSNRGVALIQGRRCPIVGRVTMDQTLVDVTDLPEEVLPGAVATLLGGRDNARLSLAEVARTMGRIPWEALTSISHDRVRRVYRRDGRV